MLQRGQMFAGRYFVGECLAQGGMGVVYTAKHVMTGEHVALKVLSPRTFSSKASAKNFQLEARVASLLGGEHVVRILDAGFDDQLGLPFLAMELLHGRTLDALVRQQGPLAPAEVLWALPQVAEALARAHGHVDREGRAAPIVHRDLKPENLFLAERERGGPVVKVLDFGIAKVLSERQTLSRELQGTPLFMASEQIEGGALTTRVDLWALGLIAFYLLTGRYYWLSAAKPGTGLTPLLNEVLSAPLEPPSERARGFGIEPSWGPGFDAWFFRCVDRDPAGRFASALEVVLPLASALGVETGRPPTVLSPARARQSVEVPTPLLTGRLGPRGVRARVARVARAARAARAATIAKVTPAANRSTDQTVTLVPDRLPPGLPPVPFASDLGGYSKVPRAAYGRPQPARGMWGVFGFVAGGLLTALAMRGGAPRADVERAGAASPGGLRLEASPIVAAAPALGAPASPGGQAAAPASAAPPDDPREIVAGVAGVAAATPPAVTSAGVVPAHGAVTGAAATNGAAAAAHGAAAAAHGAAGVAAAANAGVGATATQGAAANGAAANGVTAARGAAAKAAWAPGSGLAEGAPHGPANGAGGHPGDAAAPGARALIKPEEGLDLELSR